MVLAIPEPPGAKPMRKERTRVIRKHGPNMFLGTAETQDSY